MPIDPSDLTPFLAKKPPELSVETVSAASKGQQDSAMGITVHQAKMLALPGYLALENGYTRLPNGQLFIAARTPMPGVTGPMLDFWFNWHSKEKSRYALWHPGAHLGIREKPQQVSYLATEKHKEYIGTTHCIHEMIGSTARRIEITFMDPKQYGFTSEMTDKSGTQTVICGRLADGLLPIYLGHLIHQLREHDGNVELRSRFWIGDFASGGIGPAPAAADSTLRNVLCRLLLRSQIAVDLLTHCATEMAYLRAFLPDLYHACHDEKISI